VPDDVEIRIPEYLEAGVYANSIKVWHTRSEFTLDFLARPIDRGEPDVALAVSRLKVPTIFMFELIRRLSADMTDYEQEYGEIPT